MDTHAPFYKSAALQGVLAILVARALAHSKLASVITTDQGLELVNWALDGITTAALAWIAHARIAKPMPTLTFTKAAAIAAVALIAATSSSWSWLIAIGVAPLLLTLLPCAVMCVLGLCLMHKAGSDCKSSRQEKPDGASQARPIGPSS